MRLQNDVLSIQVLGGSGDPGRDARHVRSGIVCWAWLSLVVPAVVPAYANPENQSRAFDGTVVKKVLDPMKFEVAEWVTNRKSVLDFSRLILLMLAKILWL